LIAFLAIVAAVLKSAWLKGIIGEYQVNSVLEKHLARENYILMKDVLLPTQDGTTQIDHIVFSRYGIFVIETKNLSHWIYANNGARWTQNIYGNEYEFQNPARQNHKHLKTIEKITGIDYKKLVNLVVFTGKCQFRAKLHPEVIIIDELINRIKSYKDELIDNDELNSCINSIRDKRIENSFLSRLRHIKRVQDIKFRKTQDIKFEGENFHNPRRQKKAKNRPFLSTLGIIRLIIVLIIFIFIYIIGTNHHAPTQKNIHQNTIGKPHQENNEKQEVKIQQKKNQPVVIYSWTNDNGQRVYSNKGFPADKKYSNPKVEWQ